MEKTNWLSYLRESFPAITFKENASGYRWSPAQATVYVGQLKTKDDLITLLHETGHALARHTSFRQDVQLLKLEREAWDIAQQRLAPLFGIIINESLIEDALDTYRTWLHTRSTCPNCRKTGVQQRESAYCCLACGSRWKVNDARICQLRRYLLK